MWRDVQRLFLWVGIAILAYAGGTLAYSDAYQRYQLWRFDQQATASAAVAPSVAEKGRDLLEGDPVGKLEIPRVGLSLMVFQGIDESTLLVGAGHVPGTPLPDIAGNVVIAGHRDTFFRKLEGVVAGDTIILHSASGTYSYVVSSTETVDPLDTRVMESGDISELTLITCYPFYFVGAAPRRFIVHSRPLNAATALSGANHYPEH